jgi:hypothetical protein
MAAVHLGPETGIGESTVLQELKNEGSLPEHVPTLKEGVAHG